MAGLYNYTNNSQSSSQRDYNSEGRSSLMQALSLLSSIHEKQESRANQFYSKEDANAASSGFLDEYATESPILKNMLTNMRAEEQADMASINVNGRIGRRQAATLYQHSIARKRAYAQATARVNTYNEDKKFRDQLLGSANGSMPILAMNTLDLNDYFTGEVPKARLAVSGQGIITAAKEAVANTINQLQTKEEFQTTACQQFIKMIQSPDYDRQSVISAALVSDSPEMRLISQNYCDIIKSQMQALRDLNQYNKFDDVGRANIDNAIYMGVTEGLPGYKSTIQQNPDYLDLKTLINTEQEAISTKNSNLNATRSFYQWVVNTYQSQDGGDDTPGQTSNEPPKNSGDDSTSVKLPFGSKPKKAFIPKALAERALSWLEKNPYNENMPSTSTLITKAQSAQKSYKAQLPVSKITSTNPQSKSSEASRSTPIGAEGKSSNESQVVSQYVQSMQQQAQKAQENHADEQRKEEELPVRKAGTYNNASLVYYDDVHQLDASSKDKIPSGTYVVKGRKNPDVKNFEHIGVKEVTINGKKEQRDIYKKK